LRICSAVLVQTNGWQRSFDPSLKARILVLRSLTGPKLPRYASKRRSQLGGVDAGRPGRSDAGDLCGQEVDAVSVEVATGAVVVLGGAGVRVAGEDLGVTQGDTRVQGVGDRGVP